MHDEDRSRQFSPRRSQAQYEMHPYGCVMHCLRVQTIVWVGWCIYIWLRKRTIQWLLMMARCKGVRDVDCHDKKVGRVENNDDWRLMPPHYVSTVIEVCCQDTSIFASVSIASFATIIRYV